MTRDRIADDLTARIDRGEFRPGDRLPSMYESAKHYGTSPPTVALAYALLCAAGRATRVANVATFVGGPADLPNLPDRQQPVPPPHKTVGAALRKARREAGITQVEAALLTGLSTRTYSRIEIGAVSLSLPRAVQIADALDLSWDSLIAACRADAARPTEPLQPEL